ncbi:hypothetical protein Thiosp_03865 [Thiorhodovibrio litoralis]|nr:hypothetical protein [Thiorhodovibrio winogradskyi]WPL11365.1 hypothetical protein Thiosp_01098 [Thiorhodovibrio litoralis]WPL14034.1 hypothetical protein Thiosp_03865 [Thiorhodovibrio litoralis]
MAVRRDTQGRFTVGHPGGPGRPKRQTEAGYLSTMMSVVDLDQWRRICEKARDDALAGDEKARSWLARYLVGDPSAKAPATTEVIIQQLLQLDPALDKAAMRLAAPELTSEEFPGLAAKERHESVVRAEAAAAILQAEAV